GALAEHLGGAGIDVFHYAAAVVADDDGVFALPHGALLAFHLGVGGVGRAAGGEAVGHDRPARIRGLAQALHVGVRVFALRQDFIAGADVVVGAAVCVVHLAPGGVGVAEGQLARDVGGDEVRERVVRILQL